VAEVSRAERGGKVGPPPTRALWWMLVPLVVGALVSLTVGLLAREEAIEPGAYPGGYFRLLFTAAWIFRKLPWPRPRWVPSFHRWTGRVAFAATLPVAYHCIFKLGFQKTDDRVLAHSFLGCAVYGAFAGKVLIVRLHRFPRWLLPLAGGLLFATLVGVWYTSAIWFFRLVGVGF
jgi:Family of unknown function (DUF6529)